LRHNLLVKPNAQSLIPHRFLQTGMLHPTARPYLLELHPDQGYASIAMVAYDLLSGVLDGINSEGLTVPLAHDNDVFEEMEPTREPAVGLGELQTLRLLLDTCANVEEAKQTLMATKQYYQWVPVHYLIADRHGNAFVWEYSRSHNKEYIVESRGEPLMMTNFTLHTRLENVKAARAVCKRYAHLSEKPAAGNLDDTTIRGIHQSSVAQMSQAADPTRPPMRTFWHAFYYPEDRRVRVSYYLGEEPWPGEPHLVKQIHSDYVEFRLEPTQSKPGNAAPPAEPARPAASGPSAPTRSTRSKSTTSPTRSESSDLQAAIEAVGGTVERSGTRIVSVSLDKATSLGPVIPLLPQLRDVETLSMGNPSLTNADVRALQGLPKLQSLSFMGAPIGDEALEVMKSLPALHELNVIGTRVTDAGLVHLQGLSGLEYLGLKGTVVGDADLANLKGLTGLSNLNLADTKERCGARTPDRTAAPRSREPLQRQRDRCRPRAAGSLDQHRRPQPFGDQGHGCRPRESQAALEADETECLGNRGHERGREGCEEVPSVLGHGDEVGRRAFRGRLGPGRVTALSARPKRRINPSAAGRPPGRG
jgi:hypothetical protein